MCLYERTYLVLDEALSDNLNICKWILNCFLFTLSVFGIDLGRWKHNGKGTRLAS